MGWLISFGLLMAALVFGFKGDLESMSSLLVASGLFSVAGAIGIMNSNNTK